MLLLSWSLFFPLKQNKAPFYGILRHLVQVENCLDFQNICKWQMKIIANFEEIRDVVEIQWQQIEPTLALLSFILFLKVEFFVEIWVELVVIKYDTTMKKKKKKQLKRNKTLNSCEIFHIKCVHEKTNKPGNISQEFLIQIIVSLKTSNLGLLEVSIVWIFFFGFFFFHKNLGGNYQKIWNCNKKY